METILKEIKRKKYKKEYMKNYMPLYRERNREKINKYAKEYMREYRESEVRYKIEVIRGEAPANKYAKIRRTYKIKDGFIGGLKGRFADESEIFTDEDLDYINTIPNYNLTKI